MVFLLCNRTPELLTSVQYNLVPVDWFTPLLPHLYSLQPLVNQYSTLNIFSFLIMSKIITEFVFLCLNYSTHYSDLQCHPFGK